MPALDQSCIIQPPVQGFLTSSLIFGTSLCSLLPTPISAPAFSGNSHCIILCPLALWVLDPYVMFSFYTLYCWCFLHFVISMDNGFFCGLGIISFVFILHCTLTVNSCMSSLQPFWALVSSFIKRKKEDANTYFSEFCGWNEMMRDVSKNP